MNHYIPFTKETLPIALMVRDKLNPTRVRYITEGDKEWVVLEGITRINIRYARLLEDWEIVDNKSILNDKWLPCGTKVVVPEPTLDKSKKKGMKYHACKIPYPIEVDKWNDAKYFEKTLKRFMKWCGSLVSCDLLSEAITRLLIEYPSLYEDVQISFKEKGKTLSLVDIQPISVVEPKTISANYPNNKTGTELWESLVEQWARLNPEQEGWIYRENGLNECGEHPVSTQFNSTFITGQLNP